MKLTRNILIFLLAYLSLGAIYGGVAFIISPNGEFFKMPMTMLINSPFGNYLIPGIILLLILGILPICVIIALIKKPDCKFAESLNLLKDMHWSWTFTIYIGFALIIWIQLQMQFIKAVDFLHTFYALYGILIIALAMLPKMRNGYLKKLF